MIALRRSIGRLMAIALALLPGLVAAQGVTLQEVNRFEARFPESLEYDSTTCALWISGASGIVRRVALQGAGLSTHDTSLAAPLFVAITDGQVIAYSHHGAAVRLFGNARPVRVRGLFMVSQSMRYEGGDSRTDGTMIVAAARQNGLGLFQRVSGRQAQFVRSFGHLRPGLSYRGIAFDPATGDTLAVATDGATSTLRVFDADLRLQSEVLLPDEVGPAEGLAIQHETGDIFISYLAPGRVVGEVVHYAMTPADPLARPIERPAFECLVS